jgi:predicted transcriptional regulator
MLTKEKVISSLNDLPDSFSMDELIDKLMLLQKIETGLEQSKKGEVFSAEEAKEMLKQWSK